MMNDRLGEYKFPYAKKVYIGKDMPDAELQHMQEIAAKLNISVFAQTINAEQDGFEYRRIL